MAVPGFSESWFQIYYIRKTWKNHIFGYNFCVRAATKMADPILEWSQWAASNDGINLLQIVSFIP